MILIIRGILIFCISITGAICWAQEITLITIYDSNLDASNLRINSETMYSIDQDDFNMRNKEFNKKFPPVYDPSHYTNTDLSQSTLLSIVNEQHTSSLNLSLKESELFFKNRRNVYSSMWAFASLNYLYADLVGLMDANMLAQYQNGVVDGTKITPNFLTMAGAFMQIPIANVFLPYLIKNEKTLRWVQIASGTIMTAVQSGTLFVGKPTPYYVLFSAVEIAATTYITIDAIRWKAKSNKQKRSFD